MKNPIVMNMRFKGTYFKIVLIEVFLYIMIFLLHANMTLDTSDDANFAQALDNRSIWSYITYCYFNINGKVILDLLTAIFTRINPLIWKTVNSIVFLIIINIIQEFTGMFKNKSMEYESKGPGFWGRGGGVDAFIRFITILFSFCLFAISRLVRHIYQLYMASVLYADRVHTSCRYIFRETSP